MFASGWVFVAEQVRADRITGAFLKELVHGGDG
jgi:hypothetical protein